MSKRKSDESGMKPSTSCANLEDILAGENIPDDNRAVVLFLPDAKQGECYLRETLRSAFTVDVALPVREMTPGKEYMRVYKLPISGIWITGKSARKIVCSTHIFFQAGRPRTIPIGSADHMVSGIYNRQENVYDFEPMFSDEGEEIPDCPVAGEESRRQLQTRIENSGGYERTLQELQRLRHYYPEESGEKFLEEKFPNHHYLLNTVISYSDANQIYRGIFDRNDSVPYNPEIFPEKERDSLRSSYNSIQAFLLQEYGIEKRPVPPSVIADARYRDLIEIHRKYLQNFLLEIIIGMLSDLYMKDDLSMYRKMRKIADHFSAETLKLRNQYRRLAMSSEENMLFSLQYLE